MKLNAAFKGRISKARILIFLSATLTPTPDDLSNPTDHPAN